jgi:hypothetical protein
MAQSEERFLIREEMNSPGSGSDGTDLKPISSHASTNFYRRFSRFCGHVVGTIFRFTKGWLEKVPLTCSFSVVGTGVDPVTSRFSGARSTY